MNANLQSLVDLGIPKAKARFALTEFEDNLEVAANWCYSEGLDWTPSSLLNNTVGAPPPRAASSSPPPSLSTSSDPTSQAQYVSRPPPHHLCTPGTKVWIVMKLDQSTGKRVEGVVGEVLTRGDHPRGVKVRLVDGRVGRVVGLL